MVSRLLARFGLVSPAREEASPQPPFQAMLPGGYITPVRAPKTSQRARGTKGDRSSAAFSTGGARRGATTGRKGRRSPAAVASGGDDSLGLLTGTLFLWLMVSRVLRWMGLGTSLVLGAVLAALLVMRLIASRIFRLSPTLRLADGFVSLAPGWLRAVAQGVLKQVMRHSSADACAPTPTAGDAGVSGV